MFHGFITQLQLPQPSHLGSVEPVKQEEKISEGSKAKRFLQQYEKIYLSQVSTVQLQLTSQ